MTSVGVIGAGKIGKTIASYLKEDFKVSLADKNHDHNYEYLDAADTKQLVKFIDKNDIIVSAVPYYLNKNIANLCSELHKAYFDLTEDVEVTTYIKELTGDFMMPQCGLAPGAVNIIANNLIQKFDEVETVDLRVGALPRYSINEMAYYLTWSTDGLINEYCNMCDMIIGGKIVQQPSMIGLETIYIDGVKYEAFNTSGGIGTLCETYQNKVKNMSYKTIRYPGHYKAMKFLVSDLNLAKNKKNFAELFNKEVPHTTDDVVIILVKVTGYKNNQLIEKTYHKKIYGNKKFSAIQKATASGVCSIIVAYNQSKLKSKGFIKQEDVPFKVFTSNKFGKIYK